MYEPIALRCGLARLTAVRHGQSTANALFAEAARTGSAEVPLDCTDPQVPLSDLGRAQARATGRWLAALHPDDRPGLVLCSPCLRALQTWEGMASQACERDGAPAPVLVDERLRDRENGMFELLTPAAVRARAPEEAARRERVGEWFYRPPGGESLADVSLRLRDFLCELRDGATGLRVLVVAHDAVVVAVRHVLAGLGSPVPGAAPVANASISRWEGDGARLLLDEYGTTGHLGGLAPS